MSDLQWPLFPEYAPLVSAEQNLEEFPLFELKARKRGSKARVFEKVIEGEGGVSLNQVEGHALGRVRHAGARGSGRVPRGFAARTMSSSGAKIYANALDA